MDGLEAVEVNFKFLDTIIDYRIEAEYFIKRFLDIDTVLDQTTHTPFFEIADYENGRAYNSDEFFEGDIENSIKVSKIGDVTQKRFNNNWVSISNKEFTIQKGNYLVNDDILMSLTGDPPDVGKVSLFTNEEIKSTWNQRVARIFLKKEQSFYANQKVFFIVLSSKYCREQLERYAKGIRQRNLGTECIERLKLPCISNNIQCKVIDLVQQSINKIEQSRTAYATAEALLLATLGLHDFTPSREAVNIKSLKDSFLSSGRLDAEYYQKKYDDYLYLIRSYQYGFEPLNKVCYLKDDNFTPKEKEQYQYIELSNIGKSGEITGCMYDFGVELPSRARRIVNTGDVIISSIEGSLQSCAVVSENYNNALCSTGFYVINSKVINSETLIVLFKSEPMQQILKKGCSGTILTAISKPEFSNILIPIIDTNTQNSIAALVQESFALKQASEGLLALAKQAVEVAIEEGEEAGLAVLGNLP